MGGPADGLDSLLGTRRGINDPRELRRILEQTERDVAAAQDQARTLRDENDRLDLDKHALQQLLPLVVLREGPQDAANACYFYSRLDGLEAEFVSHHFEREARI